MITETSHIGHNRGPWLREVVGMAEALLSEGEPLRGVCLYPILGMPEWHDRDIWTPMGLWDPLCHRDPSAGRLVCTPMLDALRSAEKVEALHRRALSRLVKAAPIRLSASETPRAAMRNASRRR
jgi:hypothetical protein